jgi:uncharacterized protein YndB with AHSA1/START domain
VKRGDAVTVSTEVAVGPAEAFRLFTEEVDAWWGRGPRFRFCLAGEGRMRFEPGVGGRFLEESGPGGEPHEIGRIAAWEPGRRLLFGFRARSFAPGERTEVEVLFEPRGASTRVTVHHRGWDSVAPDSPFRHGWTGGAFETVLGAWWGDMATRLRRSAATGTARP